MAVYTNVSGVSLDGVSIPTVKSITLEEDIGRLNSQSDGARGEVMVGELATKYTATIEAEDDGTLPAVRGFSNKGTLAFSVQLDSNSGTTKAYSVTSMVCLGIGVSTDQANPGGKSYKVESVGNDSVLSVA